MSLFHCFYYIHPAQLSNLINLFYIKRIIDIHIFQYVYELEI